MRNFLSWVAAFAIALVALVGLIALINSKDQSGVDQHAAVSEGPGAPYKGEPVLSPALQDAVKRGNVVVLYHDATPPAGTRALIPPGGRALEQAGQTVVLEREPTLRVPLEAVSSKQVQEANKPAELQPFIDYWLGGR